MIEGVRGPIRSGQRSLCRLGGWLFKLLRGSPAAQHKSDHSRHVLEVPVCSIRNSEHSQERQRPTVHGNRMPAICKRVGLWTHHLFPILRSIKWEGWEGSQHSKENPQESKGRSQRPLPSSAWLEEHPDRRTPVLASTETDGEENKDSSPNSNQPTDAPVGKVSYQVPNPQQEKAGKILQQRIQRAQTTQSRRRGAGKTPQMPANVGRRQYAWKKWLQGPMKWWWMVEGSGGIGTWSYCV